MRTLVACMSVAAVLTVGAPHAGAERAVLSEEEIKRVVAEHADDVKSCYAKHAVKQKRATGRVKLGLVVDADGTVRRPSIEVEAPGVRGKRFERCVEAKVADWRFPEAKGPTEILYPFYFQHTRR